MITLKLNNYTDSDTKILFEVFESVVLNLQAQCNNVCSECNKQRVRKDITSTLNFITHILENPDNE